MWRKSLVGGAGIKAAVWGVDVLRMPPATEPICVLIAMRDRAIAEAVAGQLDPESFDVYLATSAGAAVDVLHREPVSGSIGTQHTGGGAAPRSGQSVHRRSGAVARAIVPGRAGSRRSRARVVHRLDAGGSLPEGPATVRVVARQSLVRDLEAQLVAFVH